MRVQIYQKIQREGFPAEQINYCSIVMQLSIKKTFVVPLQYKIQNFIILRKSIKQH